jgi:hypothetical protein
VVIMERKTGYVLFAVQPGCRSHNKDRRLNQQHTTQRNQLLLLKIPNKFVINISWLFGNETR